MIITYQSIFFSFRCNDHVCTPTTAEDVVCPLKKVLRRFFADTRVSFKNARSIGPLHTGGPVAITSDGVRLVTCVSEDILLTDVSTGAEICRFASVSLDISLAVRYMTLGKRRIPKPFSLSACHLHQAICWSSRHRFPCVSLNYLLPTRCQKTLYTPSA